MEKQRSMTVNGYRSFSVLVHGFNLEGDLTCLNMCKLISDGENEPSRPSADSASLLLPRILISCGNLRLFSCFRRLFVKKILRMSVFGPKKGDGPLK